MRNVRRGFVMGESTVLLRRSARFAVERLENRLLLNAGDLDTTFGTGGKVLLSDGTPTAYHQVQASAVQGDGKIVLAGSAGADYLHLNTFFVERLNANGTPDGSFGTGGVVTASFGSGIATGKSVVIQSDGKIVVGGTYEPDSTAASAEFQIFCGPRITSPRFRACRRQSI